MTELTKRLRTHAEYSSVITPIAEDMLLAADEIERLMNKRPRGKWKIIDDEYELVQCSRCGWERFGIEGSYCPNCGANMRGVRETE